MSRRITPTYILLNQITLAASSASVTFSNIPQNYGDLVLILNATSPTDTGVRVEFNNDSTNSNYFMVWMLGNGSTATSSTANQPTFADIRTYPNSNILQIMDYSSADKHKAVLTRGDYAGSTNPFVIAWATRWANTSPINTIRVSPSGFNFNSGGTLSLYGIAA
jgi:hypothetical protein